MGDEDPTGSASFKPLRELVMDNGQWTWTSGGKGLPPGAKM